MGRAARKRLDNQSSNAEDELKIQVHIYIAKIKEKIEGNSKQAKKNAVKAAMIITDMIHEDQKQKP